MISAKTVSELITKLRFIKPAAWNPNADEMKLAVSVWQEALIDACVNEQMVIKALKIAMRDKSPFFPNVGTFVAWCYEIDELKNVHKCLNDYISDKDDLHIVAYHAGERIGRFDIEQMNTKDAIPRFSAMLEEVKRDYFAGKLQPRPLKLEAPKREVVSFESKKEAAKRLKNLLMGDI